MTVDTGAGTNGKNAVNRPNSASLKPTAKSHRLSRTDQKPFAAWKIFVKMVATPPSSHSTSEPTPLPSQPTTEPTVVLIQDNIADTP